MAQKRSNLNDYDLRYASCRDIGHSWDYGGGDFFSGGSHRVLVCHACPTKRFDIIDAHGRVSHRSYKYPPGYHLEGRKISAQAAALRKILSKQARQLDRWAKETADLKLVVGAKK